MADVEYSATLMLRLEGLRVTGWRHYETEVVGKVPVEVAAESLLASVRNPLNLTGEVPVLIQDMML